MKDDFKYLFQMKICQPKINNRLMAEYLHFMKGNTFILCSRIEINLRINNIEIGSENDNE